MEQLPIFLLKLEIDVSEGTKLAYDKPGVYATIPLCLWRNLVPAEHNLMFFDEHVGHCLVDPGNYSKLDANGQLGFGLELSEEQIRCLMKRKQMFIEPKLEKTCYGISGKELCCGF